jgi:hypothetical protein
MENPQTELKPSCNSNLTPEQWRAERLGWIIDQLSMAAIAKGQTLTPERLRINAEDLIDIPKDVLTVAFGKARRELDFVPGVAEIRRLAGVAEEGTVDAEARAAWEMLELFVKRYVDCDVYGNYGPEHGWYPKTYPLLSERIIGTVRRTGGWATYKLLTDESFPFQQKRFFEEYKVYSLVQPFTDAGKLLVMQPRKELAAAPTEPKSLKAAQPITQTAIKPVSPEPTEAELHDRREMLRQQAEAMKKKFGNREA